MQKLDDKWGGERENGRERKRRTIHLLSSSDPVRKLVLIAALSQHRDETQKKMDEGNDPHFLSFLSSYNELHFRCILAYEDNTG